MLFRTVQYPRLRTVMPFSKHERHNCTFIYRPFITPKCFEWYLEPHTTLFRCHHPPLFKPVFFQACHFSSDSFFFKQHNIIQLPQYNLLNITSSIQIPSMEIHTSALFSLRYTHTLYLSLSRFHDLISSSSTHAAHRDASSYQ